MAFDPTTAYAGDFQWLNGVEDASLVKRSANAQETASYPVKLLRADLAPGDFQRLGPAVTVGGDEVVFYLWQVNYASDDAPDPPTIDDALELTVDDETTEHWLITSVAESRLGALWVCSCVKGRVNEQ